MSSLKNGFRSFVDQTKCNQTLMYDIVFASDELFFALATNELTFAFMNWKVLL
jgi:hypothetical protein